VCSFLALTIALGTGGAYAAATIGSEDIIDNSIQSVDIKDGQVRNTDLGTNQITTSRIHDDGVTNPDLAANSVDGAKVADGSIAEHDLAADSVGSPELKVDSVNGGLIANNTIHGEDIAAGAIRTSELAAGAVTESKVADGSLPASKFKGSATTGTLGVNSGLANGRGDDIDVTIDGGHRGDAAIFSANGSVPAGVLLYGVRVPQAGHMIVKVCNFSGATLGAITDLPVTAISLTP
jgi:hypothetical protein